MCGIVGYISKNTEGARIAKKSILPLLLEAMDRGSDATGLGFIENNELYIIKKDIPANEFIKNTIVKSRLKNHNPLVMIGHTRLGTTGEAKNNNNNHPLFTKNGTALVHNGVISNHDTLFEEYKIKRDGQVDSEIILKLINHFKKDHTTSEAIKKTAEIVRGSMAIAYIEDDRNLYLATSSNPIELAYEISTGNIYFGSKQKYFENTLYKTTSILGFFERIENKNDYIIQSVEDDTLVIITPEGIKTETIERPKSIYQWPYGVNASENIKTEKQTVKQLPAVSNYDPRTPIKKPSKYSTSQLEDRLDMVDYYLTLDKKNATYLNEKKRLENTLFDRYATYDDYYDD